MRLNTSRNLKNNYSVLGGELWVTCEDGATGVKREGHGRGLVDAFPHHLRDLTSPSAVGSNSLEAFQANHSSKLLLHGPEGTAHCVFTQGAARCMTASGGEQGPRTPAQRLRM